ncbi:MAG: STAS domain-containing protein [Bacteroides sp.]|nr:STAS domain-containing protein [Prevotella sp.]MCM1406995.1 STAS domain-containing protein [Treponema brennaborense]MCM1470146.1 STAS domain-containing protein [Bacteroides sp.]
MAKKIKKLKLKGSQTINEADTVKEMLLSALSEKYSGVSIDISELEDIDISVYQLLFSFYREIMKEEKTIEFTGAIPYELKRKLYICGFVRSPDFPDENTDQVLKEKMEASAC